MWFNLVCRELSSASAGTGKFSNKSISDPAMRLSFSSTQGRWGDGKGGGVGGVKVLAVGRTFVDWWWDINSLLWFSNYEHRMNMLYVYRNKNHHHNTNKKQHNIWKIDFLNNLCLHYNQPNVKSLRWKTKPVWWWCWYDEGMRDWWRSKC